MDIPEAWRKTAQKILERRNQSVFILGALDSGKTTLARFLTETALKKGFKVALLDTDIGQSTLGPPGTIGLSVMEREVDSFPTALYFIGDVSPRGHLLEIIVGAKKMSDKARELKSDILIVDSSGLIAFPLGYHLKWHKITLLSPSYVIALGENKEVNLILEGLPPIFEKIKLPISSQAKPIPREERRERRERSFRKYFSCLHEYKLNLENLTMNPPLFPREFPLYVGIQNRKGEFINVGIVTEMSRGFVKLFTPLEKPDEIKGITAGKLKVDLGGKEIGRINFTQKPPPTRLNNPILHPLSSGKFPKDGYSPRKRDA
jgi:polynucleotide 5'-kinase involved in rRNA processing